jgi:hypothetical protein
MNHKRRCPKSARAGCLLCFKRAVSVLLVDMSTATPKIYCKPQWPNSEIRASLGGVVAPMGKAKPSSREDMIMRLSSGSVAPSVIAILSAALLSGTAMSQTATGSGTQLPNITVEAPRQAARPQRPEVTPSQGSGRVARRAGRTSRSTGTATGTPMVANQASDAARTLGSDAANRRVITQFSQQPAKIHSLTGTTGNA